MEPKVISIFAGCGGSSLGYKWAGFKELLAVEWDKSATQTFKLNFPNIPIWQKDIRKVTARQILTFCKIKRATLDILDGSPPCQGFSIAGKRQIADSRNDLFKDFVRLIKGLYPRIFIMENVPGMAKGIMRGRFIEIFMALKALNYRVKCKQMNAKYYGVAQSRKRLIFIGVRKDIGIDPTFPKANCNIITAQGALKGLKDPGEIIYPTGIVEKYYYHIKPGQALANVMQKKYNKHSYFQMKKACPYKPVDTIIKVFGDCFCGVLHWKEKRFLTINELKRLSSFPDTFIFRGTFRQQWGLIGNTVMPKFMQKIAEHVKTNILKKSGSQSNKGGRAR